MNPWWWVFFSFSWFLEINILSYPSNDSHDIPDWRCTIWYKTSNHIGYCSIFFHDTNVIFAVPADVLVKGNPSLIDTFLKRQNLFISQCDCFPWLWVIFLVDHTTPFSKWWMGFGETIWYFWANKPKFMANPYCKFAAHVPGMIT